MSEAGPMPGWARLRRYQDQTGTTKGRLTPRQRRRVQHKRNRELLRQAKAAA